MIRLFTVLFFMFTSSAYAADMTIDMLNKNADGERMVYSTEVAKVAVGDTITWLPASKGHNVHFISAPDGIELVKSKMNKEFSFTFEKEGIYLSYGDRRPKKSCEFATSTNTWINFRKILTQLRSKKI